MNNREDFEEWYWSYFHEGSEEFYKELVFSRGSDGRYNGVACNAGWIAWNARAKNLHNKIPEGINGEHFADGWNAAIDAVNNIFYDAGEQQ
jgi:hypothetical protein